MGLPHAGSYNFQENKKEWDESFNSTGLKKMIISITQLSTGAPSLILLENNTSINFSDISATRQTAGRYAISFNTTDTSYVGKLFNGPINIPTTGAVSNVSYEEGGIAKGQGLFWEIFTGNTGSSFSLSDNLLANSLFTIYVNE